MASSLKTGHVGLILLFSILMCVFITIIILSAPSSSFSKVADKNKVRFTQSNYSWDKNTTPVQGKIILMCKVVYKNF